MHGLIVSCTTNAAGFPTVNLNRKCDSKRFGADCHRLIRKIYRKSFEFMYSFFSIMTPQKYPLCNQTLEIFALSLSRLHSSLKVECLSFTLSGPLLVMTPL